MTQPSLLALAKRGNPDAIASLMNRSLQPKGIEAHVTRQGDRLQILLESDQTVNPQVLTAFVRDGLRNLGLESVHSVEVLGQQTGQPHPAWSQTLHLGHGERAAAAPTAPPPPPRPAPPPPQVTAKQSGQTRPPAPPPPKTRLQSGQPTTIQPGHEAANAAPADAVRSKSVPPPPPSLDHADRFTDQFDSIDAIPDLAEDPQATADAISQSQTEPHADSEYVVEDWDNPDAAGPDTSEPVYDFASDTAAGNSQEESYLQDSDASEAAANQPASPRGDIVHLNTPSYPGIYSRDAYGKSANPILFAAVSLLTAGWIFGLIGYSLWSYLTTPIPVGEPGAAVPTQPSAPVSENSANMAETDDSTAVALTDEEVVALVEASTEKATSAAALAQTAQSADDWNLVVSQWQQAIALLQQVPESASDYDAVEAQLSQYESSLTAAEQQAANLPEVVTASLPSTVITVADETCPTAPGDSSLPLELSNVRFEASQAAQQVIGCITNNTDQTIASVFVSYQGAIADNAMVQSAPESAEPTPESADLPTSEAAPADATADDVANTVTPANSSNDDGSLQGQGVLTFSDLAPGETVPFRSGFEVPTNLATFEIQTVSWLPIGATETQQLEVSLLLTTP
ncbi:MAG: hypothetical protein ACFB8W_08540 [Elainellaceae cyanobacterium]